MATSSNLTAVSPNGFAQRASDSSDHLTKVVLEGVFNPSLAQGWVAAVGADVYYVEGVTSSPLGYQEVYSTRVGSVGETASVSQGGFDPSTGVVTQGAAQTRPILALPYWLAVDSYCNAGDIAQPGDLVVLMPGSALAGGSLVVYKNLTYRVVRSQPMHGAVGYLVSRGHGG